MSCSFELDVWTRRDVDSVNDGGRGQSAGGWMKTR